MYNVCNIISGYGNLKKNAITIGFNKPYCRVNKINIEYTIKNDEIKECIEIEGGPDEIGRLIENRDKVIAGRVKKLSPKDYDNLVKMGVIKDQRK
jgi:hypothetical protein